MKSKDLIYFQDSANHIDLPEMLAAKENRVLRQQSFKAENCTTIALTMNIAGPCKMSPLIEKAFNEGVLRLTELFGFYNINCEIKALYTEKTGPEGYFTVNCTHQKAKEITVQIEDSLAIGRLFDIDVIYENDKVSRGEMQLPTRLCIVCGDSVWSCARSRAHSVEELQIKTVEIIDNYFNSQFCHKIASLANKALLYEVSVTPKPGLVDRDNNGAHKDMDFFTFVDSAASITPYFYKCCMSGIDLYNQPAEYVFEKIRYLGRIAEDDMFKATKGINTHKGMIFSMGIICAAIGYLFKNQKPLVLDSILTTCSEMTKNIFRDFDNIFTPSTNGEQLYLKYKATGVRGQAAAGFPAVKNVAYPILSAMLAKGYNYNQAGSITLANLICHVEDTNIIKRSSFETLSQVQKDIEKLCHDDDLLLANLNDLNRQFVEKNISPGGCADLLAITFMIKFCEDL